MDDQIFKKCTEKMENSLKAFDRELLRVRTGRASITLLDGVRVNYYGNPTPINQVSTLSTPDARTIVVSPFEKPMLGEIEKAIHKADLGVNPSNDGNIIRIPIPQLTEDRRKEIAKSIKKLAEDAKISVRHSRRDANDSIKKAEKDKEIAEDESKKMQQSIQKETDKYISLIDEKSASKEKEVMTI